MKESELLLTLEAFGNEWVTSLYFTNPCDRKKTVNCFLGLNFSIYNYRYRIVSVVLINYYTFLV